jgi:hypothetical protein
MSERRPELAIPQLEIVSRASILEMWTRGLAVGDLCNDGHVESLGEILEAEPMILRAESNSRTRECEGIP